MVQIADKHGISGSNRGQMLREFASLSGLNTNLLDTAQRKDTARSARKRFPCSSISIPIPPTPHAIKKEWANLISSGNIRRMFPIHFNKIRATKWAGSKGKCNYKRKKRRKKKSHYTT